MGFVIKLDGKVKIYIFFFDSYGTELKRNKMSSSTTPEPRAS